MLHPCCTRAPRLQPHVSQVRAAGLRVLYQPFAHVVHQSHTTYAAGDGGEAKMDTLIDRNRQHFTSKWGNSMPHRPRTPDQ